MLNPRLSIVIIIVIVIVIAIVIVIIVVTATVAVFRLLDLGLKVLAMAGSACVNPILYCWSNDSIRGELLASIRQRML